MSDETEDTKFFESATSGIIKGILANWRTITAILGISGVGIFGHVDSKHEAKTEWPVQVGSHLMDLLQTNNIQEQEIKDLRQRLEKLEQK